MEELFFAGLIGFIQIDNIIPHILQMDSTDPNKLSKYNFLHLIDQVGTRFSGLISCFTIAYPSVIFNAQSKIYFRYFPTPTNFPENGDVSKEKGLFPKKRKEKYFLGILAQDRDIPRLFPNLTA